MLFFAQGLAVTSKRNLQWDSNYQKLVQYQQIHGNCDVPPNYPLDPSLGRWVRRQRFELNNLNDFDDIHSKKNQTDDKNLFQEIRLHRRKRLEALGMRWNPSQDSWTKYYLQLKEFKAIHGHTHVYYPHTPTSSKGTNTADNDDRWKSLSLWVRNQKSQYTIYQNIYNNTKPLSITLRERYSSSPSRPCFLTEERIQLLNHIGFSWDIQQDKWFAQYSKLLDFRQKYGHVHVPSRYADDPSLARWVSHQRYSMNKRRKEIVMTMMKVTVLKRAKLKEEASVESGSQSPSLPTNLSSYFSSASSLNKHRIQLLNDVGFLWEVPSTLRHDNYNSTVRENLSTKERSKKIHQSYQATLKDVNKAKGDVMKPIYELSSSPTKEISLKKNIVPFPWDEI